MSIKLLKAGIVSIACASLLVAVCSVQAQHNTQQIGSPLNLANVELKLIYSNDFSGDEKIDFETAFVANGKRTRLPDPQAGWVAEGRGGADICNGKLWVAPVAFETCGERAQSAGQQPSHMVVWNGSQFPADMLFEFTINHHGSDDGLTLVFFAAAGLEGKEIFDLSLPPREGDYRKYNRGALANYTVSYWSRNKAVGAIKKGERYSNRVRKNPGANMLATNDSLTDKCSDCDFKLRVLKVANTITVEINGMVVNHVTDTTPYGGGYIGLRSMQGVTKVSYDDFRVWSVNEKLRNLGSE